MRESNRPGWIAFSVLFAVAITLIKPPLHSAFSLTRGESPVGVPALAEDAPGNTGDPLRELARQDPLALLQVAKEHCKREIRDYRCVFLKQERLGGELTKLQRIEMRYRAEPHSVYLNWLENADHARRAAYVRGRDVNERGEELALIEPAGCVLRLFASRLRVPVSGHGARASSRRTLDQAGYKGTFQSLERVHALAASRGDLELHYAGTGSIGGRPTYVLVRFLPYSEEGGDYPNAYLVLHLDRQWLLPVGVYTYADPDGQVLLGSYTMTEVDVNPGFEDEAFEF